MSTFLYFSLFWFPFVDTCVSHFSYRNSFDNKKFNDPNSIETRIFENFGVDSLYLLTFLEACLIVQLFIC